MTAPSELLQAGLDPAQFRKAGQSQEYHGPCPFCGGTKRFRVHTDKPFPHWFCVCRDCEWQGWLDQIEPKLREPLTEEKKREYAKMKAEEEKREQERRAAKLAEFTDKEIYQEAHRRMSLSHRMWWERQGLPTDAQDYWQLGVANTAWGLGYTIPYFDREEHLINMQFRLQKPPAEGDKYRWAGFGYSSFFTARLEIGATDEVTVTEGAKKAMVYAYHMAEGGKQVYAVPSKSDFAGIAETVKNCGRVWIMLDPDARDRAIELARLIGKAARVVYLPEKLDDLITTFGATSETIAALQRQAWRHK